MELNLLAVLAAAVGGYIVGALWYSPLLFMKTWCEVSGVNPEETMTNPLKTYGTTFLLTLIGALVLAVLLGLSRRCCLQSRCRCWSAVV